MLDKKVIKDIQSLSLKKYRQEQGLFVAEGPKVVGELIKETPQQVVAIYATKEWMYNNPAAPAINITEKELERLSGLQTPNEVVAVVKQFLHNEPAVRKSWFIYLDGIQDPGNLGTIIRIGDWFGAEGIVCSAGCADVYNLKVVQATMGSIARVQVWNDEKETWLQKQKVPIVAAALNGTSLYSFAPAEKGVLIIGNESKGISPAVLATATQTLAIPKRGKAESLNAAVAAGIIVAHLLR